MVSTYLRSQYDRSIRNVVMASGTATTGSAGALLLRAGSSSSEAGGSIGIVGGGSFENARGGSVRITSGGGDESGDIRLASHPSMFGPRFYFPAVWK